MRGSKIYRCLFLFIIVLLVSAGCSSVANEQEHLEATTIETTAGADEAPDTSEIASDTPAADSAYEEFVSSHTFITDLPEEDLTKPDVVIQSTADYIYLLDYMAFYRIGEKVFFEIDPGFAEEIYNPYTIHQKAYEQADLADVYACQMDDSFYSSFGVIGVQYSMSKDVASQPPTEIPGTPVLASYDYHRTIENGALKEQKSDLDKDPVVSDLLSGSESLKPVRCENGEQLYYLVMNGYRPKPTEGSTAEQLYAEAVKVIQDCISPEMTDFQKIKAIYDWLTTEVKYDSSTAYSSETYLVKEQAYYLEGVLFNHCAVCDGKAKAAALLLNMIGIPCYRTTGVNEGGDHAWNMVQLDGKWYIFCSTYGQANMAESIGRIVPNYSMLLAGKETPYEWYPAQKHPDIEAKLEQQPFDVWESIGASEGLNLRISSLNDLQDLSELLQSLDLGEYKMEFCYTGDQKEDFQEAMLSFLEELPNANAVEIKSEKDPVYQVFIMNH